MKVFLIVGLSLAAQLTSLGTPAQERRVELVSQTGHAAGVSGIAISPDGKTLASGALDGTIKLWDLGSGIQLRSFAGYEVFANAVAFSPDGRFLLGAGKDKARDVPWTPEAIKLWEVKTGRELWRIGTGGRLVAFGPDGKLLANDGFNGNIELRDAMSGRLLRTLDGPSMSLAFSPDGRLLACGSNKNIINLWDVKSGKLVSSRRVLRESETSISTINSIDAIAFSPDGRSLVYAVTTAAPVSKNQRVIMWDIAAEKELNTFDGFTLVSSLKFSPDGKVLVIEDNGIADVRDVATGGRLKRVVSPQHELHAIAFSPDGKTFAGGGYPGGLSLWDTTTWEKKTFGGQSEWRNLVVFSRDGRSLATVDHQETIKLWDLASGKWLKVLEGYDYVGGALAFSPDGKILASGKTKIKLWDVNSGQELRELVGREDDNSVQSIAFSPDGSLLAAGRWKFVDVWDVATGKQVRTWSSGDYVKAVAFSHDGKFLLSGSREKTVRLWELSSGRELLAMDSPYWVNSVALSPDGKLLASAGAEEVELINVESGKFVRRLEDDAEVMSVVFSPDGQTLASNNAAHTIKLWKTSSGAARSLEGGRLPAWVTFDHISRTPTTDMLAYVDKDQIRLTDMREKKEVASLSSFGGNDWLVVTPAGFFDGSPASWRRLIWRFDNNTSDYVPVEAFFREFFYPDLLGAIAAGQEPPRPERRLSEIDIRQPRITFTEVNGQRPEASTPQTTRSAVIKFEITENNSRPARAAFPRTSGAQDLRLFRNGSLVKILPGDVFGAPNRDVCKAVSKDGGKKVCTVTVTLVAGANLFTAYAFNHDNVKSDDALLTVTGAENLRRRGRLYVFGVGVGKYANARYDLNYTANDARDFSEEVRRQQEKVGHYEQVEVITLLDEEATKEKIAAALGQLAGRTQPEDGVIIYFSGHGTAQGDRFYMVPHDLGYDGPPEPLSAASLRTMLAHSISDLELELAFRGIDVGRFLLVVDACHSGQALEAEERRRGPMNSKGLAQLAYEKGMNILTASQSYERAYESAALKHSYLTYALVEEGLRQGNADDEPKDGQLLLREWLNYATARVPRLREEKVLRTTGRRSQSLEEVTAADSTRVQRPRVFYRREPESEPFIIAKTGSTP